MEIVDIKQKAKYDWMIMGDRSSAFFHNIRREKKNRNRIVTIKDNARTELIV